MIPDLSDHISKKIIEVERQFNLFEVEYKGVKIYQFIRLSLFSEIAKQTNYYGTRYSSSWTDILKNVHHHLKHAAFINDLVGIRKYPVVLVESPRKVLINNNYKEIYSSDIISSLSLETCIIKYPYMGRFYKEDNKSNYIYYDYFVCKQKLKEIFHLFTDEGLKEAKYIANSFEKVFEKKLNILRFIKKSIIKAYWKCLIAKSLLAKIKPRILIVVDGSICGHFVWAARTLSIPSIELHHGNISKCHLSYHYPYTKKESVEIFPDYLLTFGAFWNTAADFPIYSGNIKAIGFHHFNYLRSKFKNLRKRNKQILFISQRSIGKRLWPVALTLSDKLPDYSVIFKLHPNQYVDWQKEFSLLSNPLPSNMTITTGEEPGLYQLLAESCCQVGVFSTALYEGLGFGLKTIIMKLPGWQYMKPVINSTNIKIASNVEQLADYIKTKECSTIDSEKFFKSGALENAQEEIMRIYNKTYI